MQTIPKSNEVEFVCENAIALVCGKQGKIVAQNKYFYIMPN